MKTGSFVLAVACVVAGCAAPSQRFAETLTAQQVASLTKVERDDFMKVRRYVGPDVGYGSDKLLLRATLSTKSEAPQWLTAQLYVSESWLGDWRFYSAAFDSDGQPLQTTVISRDVRGCYSGRCSLEEHVGVAVTEEMLRAAAAGDGLRVRIYGKTAQRDVQLTPEYVRGFLAALK